MRFNGCFIGMVLFILFFAGLCSPAMAVIRIMPLGDSITLGINSGASPDDNDHYISYRSDLWNKLVAAGYNGGIDFVGSLQSGGAILVDPDHEGHSGWRADEIRDNIFDWLVVNPADIILLHIGTNDVFFDTQDPDAITAEVSQILDEIDRYSTDIQVILALIINNENYICGNSSNVTDFNDRLNAMALARSSDKIEIVDMECGAAIDYAGGDMWNTLHPFETGYEKMADVWFNAIFAITYPVADAGPDQNVNEFDLVTLTGSNSSDPDGFNLAYQWTQTQGTAVVLSDNQSANPTFTADVDPGGEALTFQLKVTDSDGLESTDVTVVPQGLPVADAGPDQTVNQNQLVTLDGSGSHDPDQDPLTYLWQQAASDPIQVTLSNQTLINPSFTAPSGLSQDTALTFNLVVNDGHDDSPIDSVVITVTLSNGGSTGGGGGGCFIATAAYGSLMEPHVDILREFRDRCLITNRVGMGWLTVHFGPAISVTLLVIIVLIAVQVDRMLIFAKRQRRCEPNPLHTGI